MLKFNYHTHTFRCNHAAGEDREYVESAIAAGVKVLGFSDHAPYCFPEGYYSTFRMPVERTGEYVASINRLKEEYKDEIKIYLGYELEYYPSYFGKTVKMLDGFGYDFLILAQHFCGNEIGETSSGTATDDESRLRRYVSQVIRGMRTGKYFYVAHPDLIRFTGDGAAYDRHMRKLCVCAKELGIPLEINLLGVHDVRCYPRERFWRLAAEEGCEAIIGLDAHSPEHFKREAAYESALLLAEKCGIRITEPEKPVKTRAVKAGK